MYNEALSIFNNYVGLNTQNSTVLALRGLTMIYLGRIEEAVESINSSLELDPSNSECH